MGQEEVHFGRKADHAHQALTECDLQIGNSVRLTEQERVGDAQAFHEDIETGAWCVVLTRPIRVYCLRMKMVAKLVQLGLEGCQPSHGWPVAVGRWCTGD